MATSNLKEVLMKGSADVALIQEPWTKENKVIGLSATEFQVFYNTGEGRPRSCIVARKKDNMVNISQISSKDCVAVLWNWREKGRSTQVVLASCYLPYDSSYPPPTIDMKRVVDYARLNKKQLIAGCDSNAHHTVWGSTNINDRGKSLLEYLISSDLFILNKGNKPTFRNRLRREVLDLTIGNKHIQESVLNWQVSDEPSFSDHSWICFEIRSNDRQCTTFRNPLKTNWQQYKEELNRLLRGSAEPYALDDTLSIETEVSTLTSSMICAFEKSCPMRISNKKGKQPWMTGEILQKRSKVRRLFNRAKNRNLEEDWDTYRDSLKEFKKACRKAQRDSWKSFTEQVDSVSEMARLKKFLAKTHTQPELIEYEDGRKSSSSTESLRILMETNFPSLSMLDNTHSNLQLALNITAGSNTDNQDDTQVLDFFNIEKVKWAINSFKPFKSPGLDGIYPALMQNADIGLINRLQTLFVACLKLSYVPSSWQESKVIFIPKPGKKNYESVKSYRPISLTSFLLKSMERLVELALRKKIPNSEISPNQHAYCKGRSVDSALHRATYTIEKALLIKNAALGMFIDIEGAFNNVKTDSIIDSLIKRGVSGSIIKWIAFMLKNRKVKASFGDSSQVGQVSNGTPQGGILSPFLWILVMDDLLIQLTKAGYHVVCYADDLAIFVTGKFESVLTGLIQSAIHIVCCWATRNGLKVNPTKTELCLFSRKRRNSSLILPKIDNTRLNLSEQVKFLGVVFDKKLHWKAHLQQKASKALNAFWMCRGAIGKKWGLSPKMIFWVYTCVVRPILMHGAFVWWKSMELGVNKKHFEKLQRQCCLGITGALSSTPTKALETILGIQPIDLHAKRVAANTALRLSLSGNLIKNSTQVPHGSIIRIMQLSGVDTNAEASDCMTEKLVFGEKFTIRFPTRREWINGTPISRNSLVVYTDGSKTDEGCGAGIFSEDLNISLSMSLEYYTTILAAIYN